MASYGHYAYSTGSPAYEDQTAAAAAAAAAVAQGHKAHRDSSMAYAYPTYEDDDDSAAEYLHDPYQATTSAAAANVPRRTDTINSRDTATTAFAPSGAAGRGAGANAYRPNDPTIPDTPSMYTDPYEYQSNAGHTQFTATPDLNLNHQYAQSNFLDADPYAAAPRNTGADLSRNDTLRPGDSISAYNVPAPAAAIAGPSTASRAALDPQSTATAYNAAHDDGDGDDGEYQTYHRGAQPTDATAVASGAYPGHNRYDSTASGFFKPGQMGYADDEYDQDRQLKDASYYGDPSHPYAAAPANAPGLFSNQMAAAEAGGTTADPHGAKGTYDEEDDDAKRGLLGLQRDSIERQIEKRRRGIGRQRWPIFTWLFALSFVIVFIIQLIKAKQETGQAIQTRPSWNPMLGPSTEFQISFGARFVPCMRNVPAVPTTVELPCVNASTKSTYTTADECPIWQICGLDSASDVGQSWRFVTPIFMHAGFVHIAFNLLVQLTLCAQIEKLLGSIYYVLIYVAGGIGGNLLGGNFGLVAIPSVGASGAIYTCISVEIIDLVYNWRYEYRVKTRLFTSILFTIIGLALGLLPGLDNFAHIGGLAVGLLGGLLLSPSIHATRTHRIVVWCLRLAAAGLLVGYFVGLATNFYNSSDPTDACKWCRYLSCLPSFSQCKSNGLTTTSTTSSNSSTTRRELFLF